MEGLAAVRRLPDNAGMKQAGRLGSVPAGAGAVLRVWPGITPAVAGSATVSRGSYQSLTLTWPQCSTLAVW